MRYFLRVTKKKIFNQDKGGVFEGYETIEETIKGVMLPLSEKDLKVLEDGAKIEDFQNIYTNGDTLNQNQCVKDPVSGDEFKVVKDLSFNSFHAKFKRYVVERTITGDI